MYILYFNSDIIIKKFLKRVIL
ncbi:carbonate dehydratase, partial [Clostridioides difficile]|nr:carbonate dehydratase [Clostridioides difficile]